MTISATDQWFKMQQRRTQQIKEPRYRPPKPIFPNPKPPPGRNPA